MIKTVFNKHKLSNHIDQIDVIIVIIIFLAKQVSINKSCPIMRNGCDHCDYKVMIKTVFNKPAAPRHGRLGMETS